MIKKLLILPVILLIAILTASLFGILHDQITYTISPEYYTRFKFSQFGLPLLNPDEARNLVAITGIIATWWVGLILGLFFGLTSLASCLNWIVMLRMSFKAMLLTITITCFAACLGYLYGKFILIRSDKMMNIYDVEDFESFIIVGSIHTASYIGGFIGLIAGNVLILLNKRKTTHVPKQYQ